MITSRQWMRVLGRAGFAATCVLGWASVVAGAQRPQARITGSIDSSARAAIAGSAQPRARAENDGGAVPEGMKLQGMSYVFSRSDAQAAALETLIAAQQDPASPLYHQWLTPDQFASRFGVADADIAKVTSWLQMQGFTVDGVSRSKDRITFSGTAAQVQAAFGAPIHYFKANGETHFAPSGSLTIPAALSASTLSIGNLSDFRPKPHVRMMPPGEVKANFTSSQSGSHFLTPKDIATIYDVNAAYNSGYTGLNQSIAVVGQSSVVLSDIANFQNAAGLTVKAPTTILVPGSGPTVTPVAGDEGESDLDLEYTGGVAKGATIYFIYTGSNQNYGVFDSLQYAVTERIAPIISVSYGECETALGSSNFAALNAILQQAAAQGQSVIAASGDDGSTDCYQQTTLSTAQRMALAADFPASSQYVTGLGGTEFTAAAVAASNTQYWTAANGSDVISSAISYMPEMVWNDTSSTAISAGGGGTSILASRPSWQAGVPGIPAGTFRLVPDISLAASPNNAGYLYCSSDTTTKITGSCANGFRDSTNTSLTVAGGTSFAAPVFAGMLAIINQSQNSTGAGLINPTLYTLASNATTYASAFHDTTAGGNQCTSSSATFCNATGASAFAATTGYDEASGLGSVDLNNLLKAWPGSTSGSLASSTTTLTTATLTPAYGSSTSVTVTVASSATSATVPTGTLTLLVDGSSTTTSLALVNGAASYTFSSLTSGAHIIQATYSGDSVYGPSAGTISITVTPFTVSAPAITVAAGSTGTSTVTVTPSGTYTGTVSWKLATNVTLSNACYTIANVTVPSTGAVTTTLSIGTSSALCTTASSVSGTGMQTLGSGNISDSRMPGRSPAAPLAAGLGGLLALGLLGRRSRRIRMPLAVVFLALTGFGLSGCGGSNNTTTTPTSPTTPTTPTTNAAKGTYVLTLTGTDTTNTVVTGATTITLTIN